jgi:AcrR family transcriptional regulator
MTASATGAGRRPRLPKGEGRQLRDEILVATERLLLETGSASAVSIRGVADAVGVTPPSIYRHFADKTALIFEVVARHFTSLENHVRQSCEGIDDPVDRLAALGVAYIEFGIANPEPYRIMFMTRHDHVPHEYAGEILAKSAAFNLLLACVEDGIAAGRLRTDLGEAFELALGLWARVHGLTSLWVSMPDMPWADDDGFVGRYAEVCLDGIAVDAHRGDPSA